MSMVCGLDLHRGQITFDALEVDSGEVPGLHPSQIPEPLRFALTGRGARARLERFVVLVDQPSLTQAARTI